MSKHNPSVQSKFDMSSMAEALRRFGDAAINAEKAIINAFRLTAFKEFEALRHHIRITTGPWYRRWYWRAAYATANRFPDWVSVDWRP